MRPARELGQGIDSLQSIDVDDFATRPMFSGRGNGYEGPQ